MPGPILWGPNNTSNNLQNQILQGNGSLLAWDGPKNYISYNNFENGLTTGWSLGTVGTLTNGIPTGSPTFGSGASGNLSITTVTSGQIGGTTSLSYASSAATTQGNMLATQAYSIDTEDQAKVLTFKFYYSVPVGPTTGNFSGTSSNSFGIAIWDATNSVWLTSTANFGMTQTTGVGYVTGTCQTNITTASIQLVIYNANATTGAITLYFDDFFLGPQTAPFGPSMSDPVAYTPTITGFGTPTNVAFFSRRVGKMLEVWGNFTSGTSTATTAQITLGYQGGNANVVTDTTALSTNANNVIGVITISVSSANSFYPLATTTNQNFFEIGFQGSANAGLTAANGSIIAVSGTTLSVHLMVPIAGWSSNLQMSSDTDTRVVAMQVSSQPTGTITSSYSLAKFTSGVLNDTHAGFNTSTGLYTVPVTGYYRVSASLGVNATYTNTASANVTIGHNSSTVATFVGTQTAGAAEGTLWPSVTATILCNAGDTLAPLVLTSGTSTSFSSSAAANFFCVERLSGPSVIAATESVNARYTFVNGGSGLPNSTTETLSSTYATYTKIKDTHNAFNTSTGVYTIPVSGSYQVSSRISVSPSTATTGLVAATILQGGSATTVSGTQTPFAQATSIASAQVTDIFNCLAGDTITLEGFQDNGATISISSSASLNSFSITRIGN